MLLCIYCLNVFNNCMRALLSSTSILYIKKLRLSDLSKDAQQGKPGRWSNSRGQVLKQPAKPPHQQSPQGTGKSKRWSRSHQPIEASHIQSSSSVQIPCGIALGEKESSTAIKKKKKIIRINDDQHQRTAYMSSF